jgi:hypothetical protein
MIDDVIEIIKQVAEGVDHIKTIADAVKDGRDFLKARHPEIQTDLTALCQEMQKTTIAVAAASAVLTHFRFTVSGSAVSSEPARFNEHFIAHKERAARVSISLEAMRGHCSKIREHADRLCGNLKPKKVDRLLQLFGIDSTERDRQVGRALQLIYDDEMQGHLLVNRLALGLQLSLEDIGKALGPPGQMLPENVPAAATLLGHYAQAFSGLESQCNYLALDLQQTIDALDMGERPHGQPRTGDSPRLSHGT